MGDVKVITEPSVYLLGKQIVVNEELTRFLADHGVEWSSDSEVPAEVLTETAGRVCYMSFQRPRPGGNSAYLNHIKEVGHGCYDSETDVLTAKGWKAWPDVSLVDQLATIDPLTKRIEYHPPIRLVKYHHTGRMYRVESQCVDLMVTPDHRMLAAMTTTKAGRENPDYQLLTAEEIGTRSHRYLKCGEWDNPFPGFSVDRDVLALLGFAIGDGHIHGPGSTTVRFHLRRERKISWLRALCARLRDRGFRLYENPERDNYAVLLPDEGIALDLFSRIYDEDREKMIPQQVLLHASRDALEGLYEGLMQSDGHEGRTGDSFDTTSPHLPGQFQQLCLHLGFAANVCYTYGPDQRPASYGSKPLTRLSVIRRCLRPEVNKWSGSEGRSFWVDEWEGDVYCAEVPNNTLYVRRNGKPVWSGNSVLEHGVWNLLITGVSRSLTHELVRHRAGWAYSQLSQRYVDESVAEYVVPPDLQEQIEEGYGEWTSRWFKADFGIDEYLILRDSRREGIISDDAWAGIEWLFSVGVAQRAYGALSDHLSKKSADRGLAKTEARKFARQAARSVLPNATETKIFVTLNARAGRHFLEQRGSQHADPEIRKLANAMLEVLAKDAPSLFGDYERIPLPDGTYEINTKYPKV
jgi:thymidylate synthase (FAD)